MDRCPYNECKYNYRVKKGRMKMAKPQNTITKATKIILQGILNSDEERFGGNGHAIKKEITAEKVACNFKEYSISFDLPPYGAAVFEF